MITANKNETTLSMSQKLLQLRLKPNLRVVALGDSSVYGIGDLGGNESETGYGWTGRIAYDLQATKYLNLSKNGARASDVFNEQLPSAISVRADLALICVGGNDALRNNFDPVKVAHHLYKTVSELEENGTVVVLLALHDPSKIAPAPKSIKHVLLDRALQVNAALKWVASKTNAFLIEIMDKELIYEKNLWHIDRMHPGPKGHQFIADLVRRELSLPRRSKEKLSTESNRERKAKTIWLLTNGFKWFARRSIDLLPALIYLIIKDALRLRSISSGYALRLKLYLEVILLNLFEDGFKVLRQKTEEPVDAFNISFAWRTPSKTKMLIQ
jgi:lysophospholipase L1-like esterase